MAVTTTQITTDASLLLRDTSNVRWSASELLNWLNMGMLAIVLVKPDAGVTTTSIVLTTGTKQSLPAGGLFLFDISRNMGSTGLTPGRAISLVDRKLLDLCNVNWHTSSGSSTVIHWAYDEKTPKIFWVYPPVSSTPYVEATYTVKPTEVTEGQNISLGDEYEPALLDYVLFRAYSKETDSPGALQKAAAYFDSFRLFLGVNENVEKVGDPNIPGPSTSFRRQ